MNIKQFIDSGRKREQYLQCMILG